MRPTLAVWNAALVLVSCAPVCAQAADVAGACAWARVSFMPAEAPLRERIAPAGFALVEPVPALGVLPIEEPVLLARIAGKRPARGMHTPLNAERARVMLQSLSLPGWGQITTGRKGWARAFFLVDAGIWTSFASFEVQKHLRTESAVRTARIFAGIDLRGRSDEYQRIVGSFPNSDDYNRLVVSRDAFNIYYHLDANGVLVGDPVGYRAYIDAHSIGGAQGWAWADPQSYQLYRDQRMGAQRAGLRANAMLALAFANRLVSAIHAAGSSGRIAGTSHALHLDLTPDFSRGFGAVRCALRTSF